MEKKDTIFVDGMIFKRPRENAPDFIKGAIFVKAKDFCLFAKEHMNDRGWVNIDLKKSKGGNLYLALNTWEGNGEKTIDQEKEVEKYNKYAEEQNAKAKDMFGDEKVTKGGTYPDKINPDDIPF